MAFSMAMPWNDGESRMHTLLKVPPQDNPTSTMLTPQASFMLQRGSLLALGTLDSQDRPWTTLWGGSPGFSEPLGGGFIGTRTVVDGQNDPVVAALVGEAKDGEMVQPEGGKLLAGLAIELMTRKRVKIAGRMVAGTVREAQVELEGTKVGGAATKQDQVQLVTKVDQSLGNCPKYLNQYELSPALVQASSVSTASTLPDKGRALVSKADMFFLSTSAGKDMDVNHRGGPPGFVRISAPNQIVYPEYSGNRLYQSLGNLLLNPKIGITFPDYASGDVLYMTGTTEVLVGADAATILPGSNLAVRIIVDEARFVERGLPFRGTKKDPSPYNPRARPLTAEGNIKSGVSATSDALTAHLVQKSLITPSIARFTFSVQAGIRYAAGQWIALDFKHDLDIGYEHMRDEDPLSLNDDFVRTFTISSTPSSDHGLEKEFDITIRKVGPVTNYLFQQNDRVGIEVPILGVGGDFKVLQEDNMATPFVAGGVGITPLLGCLKTLDLSRSQFKLLWTIKSADIDLVVDAFKQHPQLVRASEVFLTSSATTTEGYDADIARLSSQGLKLHKRRLSRDDLDKISAQTWYICAGKPLRKEVLSWLNGKKVVFEDFDY
ncbi:hypothetical protein EK21DRAFT_66802 [Setomelanomma holmii]|uniref:FAD-binding FR-type domain-containing protein n=1 Tax=Setomelanomma holmii TaxID=210430 RepID=A0A9P4HAD0_9PLEO|nr:hypothetical protein EK21DRAFT_66802 [Setomelanomma holmii]